MHRMHIPAVAALIGAAQAVFLTPAAADTRLGCVLREPGQPARFVAADAPDRAAQRQAVADDRAVRPASQLVDACRLGQRRELTAGAYARIAARAPQRFAPLDRPSSSDGADAAPSAARAPNYTFQNLSAVALGPGSFFDPAAPWGRRGVLGTLYADNGGGFDITAVVLENGVVRTMGQGWASVANASGLIGGAVETNPAEFVYQAALYRNGKRELIPLDEGAGTSVVVGLTDSGTALVEQTTADFSEYYLTLWDGVRHRRVDFGPDVPFAYFVGINSRGLLAGTTQRDGHAVAFRHDPRTGATTLLPPTPGEEEAWGLGINTHGDVLGYSFNWGSTERIGTWDQRAVFRERIVQGTPDNPTLSNWLAFNDSGLIAIGRVSNPPAERGRVYLLPPGGPRLDLGAAVRGAPPGTRWENIRAISDVGNLLGSAETSDGPVSFLLVRDGP